MRKKRGSKILSEMGLGMSYGDYPSAGLRVPACAELLACTRRQARRQGSEQLTYLMFLKMADERI